MTLPRSNPFYSPYRRLIRAQKHLVNLDRNIKRFFDKRPYTLMSELDPDGIHEIHKFRFSKKIPDIWDDLIFEALFNMRAVLDQSAYASAICSGNAKPRKAIFAIGDDETKFENGMKGWAKDVPDVVKALFRRFKPYKGGNNAIWALNQLRNSAHTSLVTVWIGGNVHVRHLAPADFDGLNPAWDRSKNEIKFLRGKLGQPWNHRVHPTFVVGLDAIDIVGRQPAISFLNTAFGEVKNVLIATENTCRAFGFVS